MVLRSMFNPISYKLYFLVVYLNIKKKNRKNDLRAKSLINFNS